MFCVKCGAELANDVLFCTKCGERTSIKKTNSNKDNNFINIKKTNVQSHVLVKSISNNENIKILIPMVAIIAALFVVIVKLAAGRSTGTGGGLFASKKNDDKADFGLIVDECPECAEAIDSLLNLEEMGLAFGFSESKMKEAESSKYSLMHHNCSADTVMVKDKLYVYRCAVGLYSGEWKGAGPFGKGSFVGTIKNTTKSVSYDGDWAYGLPEGKGTLFINRYDGNMDMTYQGDMMAGMRHGVGLLYEAMADLGYERHYDELYTIYDETTFERDNIAQETFCTSYKMDTNEEMYYDIVVGDGQGRPSSLHGRWKVGELSPMEKQQLENFETGLVLAFTGWMLYKTFNYWEGSEAQQWLDEYKAGCAADLEQWQKNKIDMDINNHINDMKKMVGQLTDNYSDCMKAYGPNDRRTIEAGYAKEYGYRLVDEAENYR